MASLNIFGEKLIPCSTNPKTGFYRDGCCKTGPEDLGTHTVCVLLTIEFLEFSKSRGNDLLTTIPEYDFPGLKEGDHWCLCALRWWEAFSAGVAPLVYLESTNEATLDIIPLETLIQFAKKS